MKIIRRFFRHIREGFIGVKRHFAMAVSSASAITITLLLVGAFAIFALNMAFLTQEIEQSISMVALIDYDVENKTDIMAIGDSGILATGKGIEDITFESLKKIVEDDTEIISIYYGKDVSEEDAEKLRDRAAEAFTSCDVELQYGGQPIYYYILSAE